METIKNDNKLSIPKELEPLSEKARKYKSAEEFVKAQITPKIEIKEKIIRYPSKKDNPYVGKLAGKPTGEIQYTIFVDGKEKGEIFYSPKMKDIGAYSVSSKSILGLFGSKRFKTLEGAKNFIIRSKERYLPLGSVDLMTGKPIVPKEKDPKFLTDFYNLVTKETKEVGPITKITSKNLELSAEKEK
jgi:hypothetical protein